MGQYILGRVLWRLKKEREREREKQVPELGLSPSHYLHLSIN
jgi:hypothetical protein